VAGFGNGRILSVSLKQGRNNEYGGGRRLEKKGHSQGVALGIEMSVKLLVLGGFGGANFGPARLGAGNNPRHSFGTDLAFFGSRFNSPDGFGGLFGHDSDHGLGGMDIGPAPLLGGGNPSLAGGTHAPFFPGRRLGRRGCGGGDTAAENGGELLVQVCDLVFQIGGLS